MRGAFLKKFSHHRLAMISLIFLIVEILLLWILPPLLRLDPYATDLHAINKAPSAAHILGTDNTGRDIFARLLVGGRNSIYIGVMSTLVSVIIGLPLGLIAGYYKGIVSSVILRIADMFLTIPSMILVLVVVAWFGTSVNSITLIIGVIGWPQVARLLSANVMAEREKDYVLSARTIGVGQFPILIRYILPNAVSPLWISLAFKISQAMIMESGLSFLGAGVMPPEASWGNIMQAANSLVALTTRVWLWAPAGICLVVTIVAVNFVGEGIRDALDPKMKTI